MSVIILYVLDVIFFFVNSYIPVSDSFTGRFSKIFDLPVFFMLFIFRVSQQRSKTGFIFESCRSVSLITNILFSNFKMRFLFLKGIYYLQFSQQISNSLDLVKFVPKKSTCPSINSNELIKFYSTFKKYSEVVFKRVCVLTAFTIVSQSVCFIQNNENKIN